MSENAAEGHLVGIDLARVVAILLVVLQHVLFFGGLPNEGGVLTRIQMRVLEALSQCCVDLFGLISGYVAYRSARWNLRRFSSLWLQVWFTGLIALSVAHLCFGAPVAKGDLLQALFPLWGDEYWYFTGYSVVFVLAPLLNRLPRLPIVLVSLALACGITVLPGGVEVLPLDKGYSAAWLVILFVFGAFLREHEHRLLRSPTRCFAIAGAALVTTVAQRLAMSSCPWLRTLFRDEWTLFYYTSPTTLCLAVFLLLGLVRLKIAPGRTARVVSLLAPCAFGVYLLHVQPVVFNHVWRGSFAWLGRVPTLGFSFAAVAACVGVYALLGGVEMMRRRLAALLRRIISGACKSDNKKLVLSA